MGKKYIKLFDEKIAIALSDGGFSYTTENINQNQKIYVFEETDELREVLKKITNENNFSNVVIVIDDKLNI